MHPLLLTALALAPSPSLRRPVAAAPRAAAPATCHLSWRPGVPAVVRRVLPPKSRLEAEEGLAVMLRTMVRNTASHSVTGRGRDWRGVFDRLDLHGNGDGLLAPAELSTAVAEIAGASALGSEGDLEAIVRRYDRDGDGKLSYLEFEKMLKSLLGIPHDRVMLRSSPIAQPERYTTRSIWASRLRNLGGSQVLRGILPPLMPSLAGAATCGTCSV